MENEFTPGNGEYVFAENSRKKIVLIKPSTGMNNSGLIIKSLIKKWNISLENLYIIFDDVDLPLGKIRIKPSGRRWLPQRYGVNYLSIRNQQVSEN
jgi:PTH1 family peptidyl-tRNA hydrolase